MRTVKANGMNMVCNQRIVKFNTTQNKENFCNYPHLLSNFIICSCVQVFSPLTILYQFTNMKKLWKHSPCVMQGSLCTSIRNLPCVEGVMNNASAHIAVASQKCITAEWQGYHTETGWAHLNKLTLADHFLCQRHQRCLISVSFRTIIQPGNNQIEVFSFEMDSF